MQIVIDIDEDYYEIIKHNVNSWHNDFKPYNIIANGTPLPKGHGDLIDLEEVRDRYVNIIKVSNSELESLRMLAEILDTSQTIIEADKGSEDNACLDEGNTRRI